MISKLLTLITMILSIFSTPSHASATVSAGGPVMGWNPWYQYNCNYTESDVLSNANYLVSSGLAAAGYDYVNLDDCWMASSRDANGNLQADPTRFPDGMTYLSQQIHALGLKFGLYESAGPITCKGLPGSQGHYTQDAQAFASWGVDFVKIDECGWDNFTDYPMSARASDFQAYGAALKAANPSVVYSEELPVSAILAPGGGVGSAIYNQAVRDSAAMAAQWRVADDISASTPASTTILGHLSDDWHLYGFAGSGHWNDLDLLSTGIPAFGWNLTDEESELSVWAMEASPLQVSANVQGLSSSDISALSNQKMIDIDQSGAQGADGQNSINGSSCEALSKPDPDGGMAVLLANTGSSPVSCEFHLSQVQVASPAAMLVNVWSGQVTPMDHIGYALGAGQTALLEVIGN